MQANLTYSCFFIEKEELNQIKNKAHNLIDEDGYAYQSVMEAYKSKDKEKISKASIYGSEVPYQLYFLTKKCEQLCSRLCQIGNKNLVFCSPKKSWKSDEGKKLIEIINKVTPIADMKEYKHYTGGLFFLYMFK